MSSWEELGLGWSESGRADAPALVLSNSLGSTQDMWSPQLDTLNEHFRVIRYDHPGHGSSTPRPGPLSMADLGGDALTLLDHLGIRRASFAGASLGAMVGLWLAAHAPDRIDRLVLCSTPALYTPRPMWLDQAATVREHGTSEIVSPTVERWFTPHFREHDSSATAEFATMIAATDDESYALCCEVVADSELRDDLASITAGTLIVAGAEDPAAPPEHAAAIAEAIGPHARTEVLRYGAHMAGVEHPEQVNRLLLGALED